MNEKEMRELDIWLATNVFGWQEFREEEFPNRMLWREGEEGSPIWDEPDYYTQDPSAAMDVLKKCQEKLAFGCIVQQVPAGWNIRMTNEKHSSTCLSLEEAICQFAKTLFSK